MAILAVAGVFSRDDGGPSSSSEFGAASAPDQGPPPPPPRVRRYNVGGNPSAISAGAGYVWATHSQSGSLSRINARSKQPIRVELAGFPTGVSAGEGAAWIALADRGAIQRVTGTEGAGRPLEVAGFPFRIAAGEGSVWAMSQTSLERIDPDTGEVRAPVELGGDLAAIAAGGGGIWVARSGEEVLGLDPETGDEMSAAEVPGTFEVATGESAVWALGSRNEGSEGTLTRIDPRGSVAGDPVSVERPLGVAAGLGFVWVLSAGKLQRYDPGTGLPAGAPIAIGRGPGAVAVGEGSAWVATTKEGAVYRVTP